MNFIIISLGAIHTYINLDFVKCRLTMNIQSKRNTESLDSVLVLLTFVCTFITQVQLVLTRLCTVNTLTLGEF